MKMVLHTQYRILLRHEDTGWLTLVTTDSRDDALDELHHKARDCGRRNIKLVATTRFCEPADFLT